MEDGTARDLHILRRASTSKVNGCGDRSRHISPRASSKRRCRSTIITSIPPSLPTWPETAFRLGRRRERSSPWRGRRRHSVLLLGLFTPVVAIVAARFAVELRSALAVLAVDPVGGLCEHHGGRREAVSGGTGLRSPDRSQGASSATGVHAFRDRQPDAGRGRRDVRRSSSTTISRRSLPPTSPTISTVPTQAPGVIGI